MVEERGSAIGVACFSTELRLRDARTPAGSWRATAMRDAEGRIERCYGTCTDIELVRACRTSWRARAQSTSRARIAGAGVFDHDHRTG